MDREKVRGWKIVPGWLGNVRKMDLPAQRSDRWTSDRAQPGKCDEIGGSWAEIPAAVAKLVDLGSPLDPILGTLG